MPNTDILIVGGGPAGVVAAVTAKKLYPDKDVALVRKEERGVIPCGIPYIFRRLNEAEENLMPDKPLTDNGISLIVSEVAALKPKEKEIVLADGETMGYDKLILASGSDAQPVPIPGADKEGVWLVKKNHEYLKRLRQAALDSRRVVIIGGGFIGVEFAEELSGLEGMEVSIVEMGEHCLLTNFDENFALAAEERLTGQGVEIHAGQGVKEIGGAERVEYVELNNGERLPADLIIVSIGAKPSVKMAEEAGLRVEDRGAIWVDEYLKTSEPDIFAVGDCAQTTDFITGRNVPVMLASVAANEARVAACNLYQLRVVKEHQGTIGVFSTSLNGLVLGVAGLTERRAKEENVDYLVGEAQAPNHHPGKLPNTEPITVKLLFSKGGENRLLGGAVMGPESVAEMVNVLAMAIQQRATLCDIETWQIATHPLLTAAPTVYPLIAAAQNAMLKGRG